MHLDLHTLQIAAMALVFALIFAGRTVKGSPRQTAEGIAFPLKPLVVFARAIALPAYFLLFAYPLWISRQSIPVWLLVLLLSAVIVGVFQLPGTIVLTPESVVQRFWLRAHKVIPYPDIMAIQAARTGNVTRVLGNNRITITHTFNHSASAEFRTEISRRTGKPISQ